MAKLRCQKFWINLKFSLTRTQISLIGLLHLTACDQKETSNLPECISEQNMAIVEGSRFLNLSPPVGPSCCAEPYGGILLWMS